MYNSFQGDTSDLVLLLEQAGGRRWEKYPLASSVSGEDCSQPLDACQIRSLPLRKQFLKYADKPLSWKNWEMGDFACLL